MRARILLVAALCACAFAQSAVVGVPQSAYPDAQALSGADAITIPQMLSYQGKLTDTTGIPVPDGDYSVVFRLYTAPSGGSPVWNETQNVTTKDGLFSNLLGSVTPIGSMPDGGAAYLAMVVEGGAELTPRLRIASAGYAYLSARAANADLLQGKDTTALDSRYVNEAQANSVTGAMLVDGTVQTADIADTAVTMAKVARAGASTGQVVKWTGSAWAPGPDNTGGGSGVTNVYQDTGIVCVPNPITTSGNVKLDLSYGDGRYVNEAQANSITSAMITDGNVTSADIRDTTVTAAKLKDGAVTSAKVLDGTITSADIRDTTVNTAELKDAAVTAPKLNQMGATTNQVLKWTGSAWAPRNDSIGSGSSDSAWVRGSPDSVLLTIRNLGIARGGAGNALLGTQPFTHVNLGTRCSTGFHSAAVVHATIGGGYGNLARSNYAAVGGGDRNRALEYSSVSGGSLNEATGQYAAIGGGSRNEAGGQYAAIGGGTVNDAGGQYAAVGGGAGNRANGWHATVADGGVNSASDSSATVAGGSGNEATARSATVGGGSSNAANAGYATVGGGYDNTASGEASSVGGGSRNSALGANATIAGGVDNRTMNNSSFVGGGYYNRADGAYSVIAGGSSNSVTGERSTIAGGSQNIVNGTYAAVGGGSENSAYGYYSMIPGGEQNRANGRHSFAAGRYARANHRGAFVWSDSAASAAESVYSTNYNQFRVRARGGTWFFSNSSQTTGVTLASNSNAWASHCDSTNKEDFREVDRHELLEKVTALRVRNYKMKDQDDGTRHIGPVAQDFSAAFGVGEGNTSINMADADGVLFAAVQALYEEMQSVRALSSIQQAEIEALKAALAGTK